MLQYITDVLMYENHALAKNYKNEEILRMLTSENNKVF